MKFSSSMDKRSSLESIGTDSNMSMVYCNKKSNRRALDDKVAQYKLRELSKISEKTLDNYKTILDTEFTHLD